MRCFQKLCSLSALIASFLALGQFWAKNHNFMIFGQKWDFNRKLVLTNQNMLQYAGHCFKTVPISHYTLFSLFGPLFGKNNDFCYFCQNSWFLSDIYMQTFQNAFLTFEKIRMNLDNTLINSICTLWVSGLFGASNVIFIIFGQKLDF